MRCRHTLVLVLLSLILSVSACGSKEPEPPKAQPSPGSYCLWVLWSNNPQIFKKAQDMLAQKKSFSETATVLSKEGGEAVRSNLDCMPAKRMDPLLLNTVSALKLGQVSQPIDLDKGQALVMRTTDKYRREGFRLYEQGMYAQAEAMLLKDLAPASPQPRGVASIGHVPLFFRQAEGLGGSHGPGPVPAAQQRPHTAGQGHGPGLHGQGKRSPGSLSASLGNGTGQRPWS